MLISGIQKLSLLDFPDTPACIVFTPGCNFRCGMCHNPEFVLPEKILQIKDSFIPEDAFFAFLQQRKDMLEGVVITGGEPTLMGDLIPFTQKIKNMGFKVKLDSNGSLPQILQKIIDKKIIDYIAMDIKSDPDEYETVAGLCMKPERIRTSIKTIINSGIPHEFRSTLIKEIHTPQILRKMAQEIRGAQNIFLQSFRSEHTLDPAFKQMTSFDEDEMKSIADTIFAPTVKNASVRM